MEVRFKLTKYRVAMAALFVLAGVGLGNLLSPLVGSALATVGQTVNLSDHSSSAYFAKVDSSGALKTTAAVTGRVGMAAPPSPWHASVAIQTYGFPGAVIAGPSTAPINITSISVTSVGSGQSVDVNGYLVPTSATTCSGASFDTQLWEGKTGAPVAVSFPTPLQYKPPANKKACVFAFETTTSAETALSVVGFYG
jgi:hypothetical protein